MILDKIFHVGEEGLKYIRIGCNNGGFHTVASCQVLRGNDGNSIALDRANKYDLGMIVGKIGMLNNLREESPETERFVCRLKIEHKSDRFDFARFRYKIQATKKLLGNRERGLPNSRFADLVEYPFNHIGDLERVREITLQRCSCKGLQVIVYCNTSFHTSLHSVGTLAAVSCKCKHSLTLHKLSFTVVVVGFPVSVVSLVELNEFFEERITLAVRACGVGSGKNYQLCM